MNPAPHRIAHALTYAGTLPLLGAALGLLSGMLAPTDAIRIATTYSAIIVAFLAGIHWACALFFAGACPRNFLLTSNAVALLAWLSVWMATPFWSILLQILCFLYLLVLDDALHQAGIVPMWFYTLRRKATVIVVVALSILMGLA